MRPANMTLWGATLWLPGTCKTLRDANRYLHKWNTDTQRRLREHIAFTGGIFQKKDAFGKISFHIHIAISTPLTDVQQREAAYIWMNFTGLPSDSVLIEPLYDLTGWLDEYIFTKNVKEADDWKFVNYKRQLFNGSSYIKKEG